MPAHQRVWIFKKQVVKISAWNSLANSGIPSQSRSSAQTGLITICPIIVVVTIIVVIGAKTRPTAVVLNIVVIASAAITVIIVVPTIISITTIVIIIVIVAQVVRGHCQPPAASPTLPVVPTWITVVYSGGN
jgi:hypothetical protein